MSGKDLSREGSRSPEKSPSKDKKNLLDYYFELKEKKPSPPTRLEPSKQSSQQSTIAGRVEGKIEYDDEIYKKYNNADLIRESVIDIPDP